MNANKNFVATGLLTSSNLEYILCHKGRVNIKEGVFLKKLFSIGTVAKLKGVSVKMLRHYDEIGLLKPSYIDPDTGYRYYSSSQLLFIEFITFFRRGGASLKEIADACQDDNALAIADFAGKQIEKVQQEIEMLKEAIVSYEGLRDHIYTDTANAKNQGVYWRRIGPRDVIKHNISNRIITEEDIYKYFWDIYKEIRIHDLRTLYATGSIVMLPQHRNTAELYYMDIFCDVALRKTSLFTRIETLPQGEYLCVNYKKKDKKIKLDLLKDAIEKIDKWPTLCVEVDMFTTVTTWNDPFNEMQVLFS